MYAYTRYGISVGQVYQAADGSGHTVTVTDVETFKDCADVVVVDDRDVPYRIDCFKLSMVRYYLSE